MFSAKYYKNKRSETADLLKGIAVLLMIQVHITELFLQPHIYNSTFGKVSLFLGGPPAAPLFMAVMGYFLAFSKKTFSQGILRGILLLAGGLLLNMGLNANLLLKIYEGKLLLNPVQYIFGVDVLFLAGLSIILISILKPLFKKKLIYYLILLPIPILVHAYLPTSEGGIIQYINAYFWGSYSWSYFPLFPWFSYVLLGFVFALILEKYRAVSEYRYNTLIAGAFAIILTATFLFAMDISAELEIYYHHNFTFFTWVAGFLFVLTFFVHKLEKYAGKVIIFKGIKFFGQNVTLAYVFQWLIIGNTATEVFKTFTLTEGIIAFFIVCLLTFLLIFIYLWIKENYFEQRRLVTGDS